MVMALEPTSVANRNTMEPAVVTWMVPCMRFLFTAPVLLLLELAMAELKPSTQYVSLSVFTTS